uniref:Alpha/beta hydrolase n=1 Tax=Streptomyces sp. NBC_01401 TaxID=2903854 RepID=A0AAU3GRM2_9ACTN
MVRTIVKSIAVIAVCCVVGGVGLVAYEEYVKDDSTSAGKGSLGDPFTGTKKVAVGGSSVNVSCSGDGDGSGPLVMLMAGGGDGLDTMAPLQKSLSGKVRVCSYDRLGEGKSDKPKGMQGINDTGEILTSVLDRLAGDRPVVLAGHSLGGYIAARYAPDHKDRIKGLVLMDATIPTLTADVSKAIPEDATGIGAQLREQTIGVNEGENPEKYVIADGEVHSAGDVPVEILRHESQYAQVPEYEKALEKMWADGQKEWRAISSRSTLSMAPKTGHYIHTDRPDLALKAIQKVTAEVTDQQK